MPRTYPILLAAVLWALAAPQTADAPDHALKDWQAKRVSRANAALLHRPGFRVERVVRLTDQSLKIYWSEPGYLGPLGGRDTGCDVVQLRGTQFWLKDDSVFEGFWKRWL